jgi:hypothetical protein
MGKIWVYLASWMYFRSQVILAQSEFAINIYGINDWWHEYSLSSEFKPSFFSALA